MSDIYFLFKSFLTNYSSFQLYLSTCSNARLLDIIDCCVRYFATYHSEPDFKTLVGYRNAVYNNALNELKRRFPYT